MTGEQAAFYGLGALALGSALYVVCARNTLHAAVALIGTFFCVAGIFVTLDAHFVAAIQILVYAGAIMVLFVFVIMLLNLSNDDLGPPWWRHRTVAKALSTGVVLFLTVEIARRVFVEWPAGHKLPAGFGTVEKTAQSLFTRWVFPFEVVSLLLLAAILGSVILAKKRA